MNRLTKIPEKEALLLVRALGLLVSQAGIYGPSHRVTLSAAASVFAELDETVKRFGPVELAIKDKNLLLNGFADGLDMASVRNLSERMTLLQVGGLLFLPPADKNEFLACITLMGTPPLTLAAQGGFEAAIKKAGLRSVKVVTVAYQRVAAGTPPASGQSFPLSDSAMPQRNDSDVEDLAAAWVRDFGSQASEEEAAPAEVQPLLSAAPPRRQAHTQRLASLLRETAELLESDSALTADQQHQRVTQAVTRLRDVLVSSAEESEHNIAALADQVDADRQTIASIESAARRRGLGIRLTRAELVERYAELNQEIIQPLTVSSGVIDMLSSGKAGELSAAQHDMLRLASESVERVNQLVAYMRRIAGLPDSLTPDAAIIAESYR